MYPVRTASVATRVVLEVAKMHKIYNRPFLYSCVGVMRSECNTVYLNLKALCVPYKLQVQLCVPYHGVGPEARVNKPVSATRLR